MYAFSFSKKGWTFVERLACLCFLQLNIGAVASIFKELQFSECMPFFLLYISFLMLLSSTLHALSSYYEFPCIYIDNILEFQALFMWNS